MNKTSNKKMPARVSNKEIVYENRSMDYILSATVIILVLFGVIMIFSSSYYFASTKKEFGYDMYYFLKKQALFAVVGIGAMLLISNIDYKLYKNGSIFLLYGIAVVLLIYVSIFGQEIGGAKRWIGIPGTPINFQPSELAKASIIFIVPYLITMRRDSLKDVRSFSIISGVILFMAILVGKENLSTAIIVCAIGFGVIFIASPYTWRFVVMAVAGATGMLGYLYLAAQGDGFRGGRFNAWRDPFSDPDKYGFQIIQSLYAISSGGFFGLGLGNSRQKLSFIPEAHNDIIFAIVCEELGLFGAIIVLFLFTVVIWRGFKIAVYSKDTYAALVACGITLMIGVQVLINIAVVTNSIPNTGIPLPFVSYGGTSLLFTLSLVGVLLNISRYANKA